MEKVRENLGNLECCLSNLKQQRDVLEIFINDYFDKSVNYVRENSWELAWEYGRYQSLIQTVLIMLIDIEKKFDKNVYEIYDELINLKDKGE